LSQAEPNLAVGVINYIFFSLPFYDTLIEKKIRGILEYREEGTELIGQKT
jgi:hypothetical protein